MNTIDRIKTSILGHFSPITTNWFQGSALEPTDLQALPGLCDK